MNQNHEPEKEKEYIAREKKIHKPLKPLEGIPYDHDAEREFWRDDGVTNFFTQESEWEMNPGHVVRFLQECGKNYPNVDTEIELQKARDWLKINEKKRPKKSLIAFLRNWVGRANLGAKSREPERFVRADHES